MNLIIILVYSVVFVVADTATDQEFIINTKKCELPDFPPFGAEVNDFYVPQDYETCTNNDLLTYTTVMNNTAFLHIIQNQNYYLPQQEFRCCYSYVTRKGSKYEPDIGINLSSCTYFNTSVPLTGDIVKVKCYVDKNKIVYENVHSPITISTPLEQKLTKFAEEHKETTPINVLFVVIDSVSRLNFIRTMPKTRGFLLDNGFIEFRGYNKIDDNTFPNFNALLTGLNWKQSVAICQPKRVGKLDECPMIWYEFRKRGYITAYAEDWASISTFNFQKKGFKNPPTDYYFKPYFDATETLNITNKDGMPYCTGPETQGERVLNLAKDFTATFKNQPHFGIFWMNTFSHNHISAPSGMDDKLVDFFQDIRENGVLNSTIVVLLSDHGIRFGKIRFTLQGWYEERLPVNLISVPEWFKTRYPSKYDNLKKNANKLTSTYDLYMTLQDVLNMSVTNYTVSPSMACPTCSSLFSEHPEDRSCEEAGVPDGWCTCLGLFSNGEINTDLVKVALNKAMPSTSVRRILSSRIRLISSDDRYYLIIFETSRYALHQALFRIRGKDVKVVHILGLGRSKKID